MCSKLDEISHLLRELPFYNTGLQLGLTPATSLKENTELGKNTYNVTPCSINKFSVQESSNVKRKINNNMAKSTISEIEDSSSNSSSCSSSSSSSSSDSKTIKYKF